MRRISLFALASLMSVAHADNSAGKLQRFVSMAFDDNGRILAVGSANAVNAKAPQARHIDVQGKTVLPGLIDAHGHVFGLGDVLTQLDLANVPTLAQALSAVATYAAAHPQQAWLRGFGWNQEIWKLGRFPTAQELDGAVADSSASTATPAGPTPKRLRRPASPTARLTRSAARSCATRTAWPPACWSTRPRNWLKKCCRSRTTHRQGPSSMPHWANWRRSA
jgi:hypothetical protein